MESNNHHEKDLITSSEEVYQHEEAQDSCNEVISTRRSYECVFCKRGFTTAQALGGHMNIHRKDRARNKPSSMTNPRNHDQGNFPDPIIYQPISRFTPCNYMASGESNEAQVLCRTYFPAASTSNPTATASPLFETHNTDNHRLNLSNPFGEDWRLGFNLEFGVAAAEDTEGMEKKIGVGRDIEELDLELRLGHHP